ncbi:SH3 domain-containing protein [Lederbergia sp. NSJ-179]|uniref:SH3 domain-containing protein n=1 Tax=Lederbergia sp. NSJ-179 TaxID=2931402 RepID=UPI001FD177A9|nr:SH3 domain-containing protein [Lederbergia sp. NSJ-179]MCJ7842283.1 SH3 domain-containing protein [Lederbergia sp. NSJ-179]
MKKRVILPSLCFAVLSTVAFEQKIQAAEPPSGIESQHNEKYVAVDAGSTLNMRDGASTSAPIISKLAKGTSVIVLSESGGWSKIKANGKTGYVSSQFLTGKTSPPSKQPTAPTSPSKSETKFVSVNAGSTLNLRSSASTSASVLAGLSNGTAVTVESESKGWAKVKVNGKTGYVSSQFLTGKASTPSKQPTTPTPPSKSETKFVSVNAGSTLNLRSSASTSASVLAGLSNGTAVTVESESNGWAKVKVNGKTGYVSSQFLTGKASTPSKQPTTPTPPSKSETKYVSVNAGSTLNLRSNASTSSSVLAGLSNGTAVTVESESNGWSKVKVNGKTGYVSSQFLTGKASPPSKKPTTPTSPSKSETKYVSVNAGSTLNLRSNASTSSSVLAGLSNGTAVTVESESNGWAKVKVNGKTGYVSSQFLTGKASTPSKQPTTPTPPSKSETKYVSVNAGSTLNLRSNASTSSSVLAGLSNGTAVTVESESNGWAKVKVNGKTGYVSSQFLTGKASPPSKKPTTPTPPSKTETKYVSVNAGSTLNLRSNASTSSSVLAGLSNGTAVTVESESKGWAKVKVNGETGYVSSQFLTGKASTSPKKPTAPTSPSKTETKYVSVNAGSTLNLRSSASTSASIIASLSNGTAVTVESESKGWAKVKVNGKTGYVSSEFLTGKASTPSKQPTTPTPPSKSETKFVSVNAGSTLNLRSSASTSASVLAGLSNGTAVTVESESKGWAKVKVNGKTGYVSSQFLTGKASTPSKQPTAPTSPSKTETKYVSVNAGSTLNLRSSASTSSSVLAGLSNGTAVTVESESNGWAKVKVNGKTGYVSSQFLTGKASTPSKQPTAPTSPSKTETKYVSVNAGSTLNLRSSASTSSSVLAGLSNGTAVTVESESNGWAKVKVNGKTGYVSSQFLKAAKENANETAPRTKYIAGASTSGVSMYTKPSTSASVIVRLASGVPVQIYSEENGWTKIRVYGEDGYVESEFLSDTSENADDHDTSIEKEVRYVSVDQGSSLNMRSSASTSGSIITKLSRGTAVKIFSEKNGWSKVSANGKIGYVSTQYLTAEMKVPQGQAKETIYSKYDLTLDEFVNIQMKANPQTDTKYHTYIREDALAVNSKSNVGTVQGNGWNVRGGAGTDFWTVGQVSNGTQLKIVSSVKGTDGYTWYQVDFNKTWVNASPKDVKQYLDPNNSAEDPIKSLQFVNLATSTKVQEKEVNDRILSGKGILSGKASAFIQAGESLGVNEMYLISHALLETGNGKSALANGVKVNGKTVYNMYGIGAFDGDAVAKGAQFAYNAGWFTPEQAIIGGAKYISNGYIYANQNTLYKMRWNPDGASATGKATHQYATDIGWAEKQIFQLHNLYSLVNSYKLVFDIPIYK